MPPRPLHGVIHHLRRVVSREGADDLTDAQLLDEFVRRRDEAAFELLVWRHASLVLGACRRLLRDRHEAEDAFQATFLVLVRKASSIGKGDSLGSWLHRVACRIAGRARMRAARRACSPLPGDDLADREEADAVLWRDLRPVLDEEVDRLPEKFRRPFVLCYLEGHTNEQAARELGCPRGTILSRLARGRERLRERLARRGVVLSGVLLAALLVPRASEAAVPAALVGVIVKAATPFAAGGAAAGLVSARAAAWTEGVLKAMLLTKLKFSAAAAAAAALVITGAGLLSRPSQAAPRPEQAEARQRPAEPRRDARDGRTAPTDDVRGVLKAVDADKGTITLDTNPREEGADRTFTLSRTVAVGVGAGFGRRGGAYHEGKLSDLAPGAIVTLQMTADGKAVECVLADGPTLQGVVKSADGARGTLTLTMHQGRRGEREGEKTYTVGPNADVAIDDGRGRSSSVKEAKVGDLPAGALATVKLSADLKRVLNVLVEGPTVGGAVKSVDAGKRQITLTSPPVGRGDPEGEQTYTVAAGVTLLVDDGKPRRTAFIREGKLDDLPAGAVVMLKLSPDQREAVSVRAEGPTVLGLLKAADPDKGRVTIILRAGRGDTPEEDKTFSVSPDTHILFDGKEAKLADLKADDNGPPVSLRLSLDQKVVQSITVGGRGRGER
jgi:RNA polymerase sigma factor (sigma-70 family)